MNPVPGHLPQTILWADEEREILCEFVRDVVGTPLNFRILHLFLLDPSLCLSSEHVAQRLGERTLDVQEGARELHARGAFNYCRWFAYSDLCCLGFSHRAPAVQHRLRLLHFALRVEPHFVQSLLDGLTS